MHGASWEILTPFVSNDDRIGGNEVQEHELTELATLLEECELHELKSTDAYFSWTK